MYTLPFILSTAFSTAVFLATEIAALAAAVAATTGGGRGDWGVGARDSCRLRANRSRLQMACWCSKTSRAVKWTDNFCSVLA